MSLVRWVPASLVVAAAFALTSCSDGPGGSGSAPPANGTTPTSPSTAPPTTPTPQELGQRCMADAAGVETAMFGPSGQQLFGAFLGEGERGVVLVHGSGSRGLCSWLGEVPWIAEGGFRVVAYDQACVRASQCSDAMTEQGGVAQAVLELRSRGASSVVVVGASAGGPIMVEAASTPADGAVGFVALSPAGAVPAATPTKPLLVAADPSDSSVDTAALLELHQQAPSLVHHEEVTGGGHAQELLYGPAGPPAASPFRTRFLTFLATLR